MRANRNSLTYLLTEAITTASATPNQTEQNQNNARPVNGGGRGCRVPARARGRGQGGRGAWNGQWNPPPQQPATRTTPSSTQPVTYSTAECTNCGWTHRDGNCAATFSLCYGCERAGHFAIRCPKHNAAPTPQQSQAAQSCQPCVNSHQLSQWEALGIVIFDPPPQNRRTLTDR